MVEEFLSPEAINREHGHASWKCWGCKAETGLHWHNGWSVAMCRKPECAAGYNEMCKQQIEHEEEMAALYKETYG
jgi:hypothetical protein